MNPVYDLIKKRGLEYGIAGNDYTVKCLNPEHNDSNPSLRVDKVSGTMHCFSCGFKGNIFTHYGLSNNFVSIKVAKLKEKLRALERIDEDVVFPSSTSPFARNFRGIDAATYRRFGAFISASLEDKYLDRLYFPIKNLVGRISSYVGRCTRGDDSRSRYLVYPSKSPVPLYPSIFPPKTKSVVLVEGIFDAINLYDKGMNNVACCFGVDSITKDTVEEKLLPIKVQDISKIYILFDGDKAGRDAAYRLKPLLIQHGYWCEVVKLPEGADPGGLTKEEVDSIVEYMNEKAHINENSDY